MYDVTLQLNAKLMPIDRNSLYEEPISEQLEQLGIGTVKAGGTNMQDNGEIANCEVNIKLEDIQESTVQKLLTIINEIKLPKGSILQYGDQNICLGTLEGLGVYVNGADLEEEVYQNFDLSEVISKLNECVKGLGKYYSYRKGGKITILYFYGTSFDDMQNAILPFLNSHPFFQNCRIKYVNAEGIS